MDIPSLSGEFGRFYDLPFIGMAMLAWVLGERVFSGLRGAKAK